MLCNPMKALLNQGCLNQWSFTTRVCSYATKKRFPPHLKGTYGFPPHLKGTYGFQCRPTPICLVNLDQIDVNFAKINNAF